MKQGAKVLVGGKVNTAVGTPGWFVQPTLLVDVTPDMEIAQHEVRMGKGRQAQCEFDLQALVVLEAKRDQPLAILSFHSTSHVPCYASYYLRCLAP